jgi:hypothetical protein
MKGKRQRFGSGPSPHFFVDAGNGILTPDREEANGGH